MTKQKGEKYEVPIIVRCVMCFLLPQYMGSPNATPLMTMMDSYPCKLVGFVPAPDGFRQTKENSYLCHAHYELITKKT